MTRMLIDRLVARDGERHAIVVLADSDRSRRLAFTVPLDEAHRLARAMRLGHCTCVPVLDLIEKLLDTFGGRPTRVVIDGRDGAIGASLHVEGLGRDSAVECHPADGLALAVRGEVPIYASELAMQHAEMVESLPADGVSAWLDEVNPEDFVR